MVLLRQEVNVSRGHDADQLASHLAGFCNRDPRETVADLGLKHVAYRVSWAHYDGVRDEALLKFLTRTKYARAKHQLVLSVASQSDILKTLSHPHTSFPSREMVYKREDLVQKKTK